MAQNNNCKTLLTTLYNDFRVKNQFVQTPYAHLNYTLVQTINDPRATNKLVTENIDLYAGKNLSYLKAKSTAYYQNSSVLVSVIPSEKLAIIGQPKSNKSSNQINDMLSLQDSLLKHCQVSICTTETKKGTTYQKIVLKPSAKLTQRFNITQITYYIDLVKNNFYEISVDYNKNNRLKQTLVRFNTIDYNYKGEIFNTPPLKILYDNNNKLLPNYKNYRVNDYRH